MERVAILRGAFLSNFLVDEIIHANGGWVVASYEHGPRRPPKASVQQASPMLPPDFAASISKPLEELPPASITSRCEPRMDNDKLPSIQ